MLLPEFANVLVEFCGSPMVPFAYVNELVNFALHPLHNQAPLGLCFL